MRTLHRHDGLALGVTWRGNEVCSGGRDGRVICTDVTKNAVTVVDQRELPIQSVHSSGGSLAYAVEDDLSGVT